MLPQKPDRFDTCAADGQPLLYHLENRGTQARSGRYLAGTHATTAGASGVRRASRDSAAQIHQTQIDPACDTCFSLNLHHIDMFSPCAMARQHYRTCLLIEQAMEVHVLKVFVRRVLSVLMVHSTRHPHFGLQGDINEEQNILYIYYMCVCISCLYYISYLFMNIVKGSAHDSCNPSTCLVKPDTI